jgi:adenylate cyclase
VTTSGVDYHAPMRVPRLLDASLYSICLVVLLAALADLTWLHRLAPIEAALSDAMIRLRAASRTADPSIVVVDIDDRSLAVMADRVGRFPWPRSVYGEVLLEMKRQGAAAVVVDVELYEPDLVRPEQDLVLNEALAGSTNTFFPIRLLERIDAEEGVRLAEFADALALSASPAADPPGRADSRPRR